jgi:hypothetical protein
VGRIEVNGQVAVASTFSLKAVVIGVKSAAVANSP